MRTDARIGNRVAARGQPCRSASLIGAWGVQARWCGASLARTGTQRVTDSHQRDLGLGSAHGLTSSAPEGQLFKHPRMSVAHHSDLAYSLAKAKKGWSMDLGSLATIIAILTSLSTIGGFCVKVFTKRTAEEVLTDWFHPSQPLAQVAPSPAFAVAEERRPPSGGENTIFSFFHPKKTKEQWLEEGDTAAKSGHYDEALGAYNVVIQLDPKDAVAQRRKGYMLNQLKRYDEALVTLDEAIRLDPQNAHAFAAREEALKGMNRHPEALAARNQAVQLEAITPKAQAGKSNAAPPGYGPPADAPQSAALTLPSPDNLQAGVPQPLAPPGVSPQQAPPAPWTPPAQPIPPGTRPFLPHPARKAQRWSLHRLIPHPWLFGVSLLAVLIQTPAIFGPRPTPLSLSEVAGFGLYILWGAGIAGMVIAGRGRNWVWFVVIPLTLGYALPLFSLFGYPKKKKQGVPPQVGTGESPMQPAME